MNVLHAVTRKRSAGEGQPSIRNTQERHCASISDRIPILKPVRGTCSLRVLTSLAASFVGLTLAQMAHASPSTIQVCTQVASNGDNNPTEGGSCIYSVSNQTVTYQNPATVRDESQSASPPSCAAAVAPPGGSTSLNVLQNPTPPANWLRDAPGYPQWTITDGTHQVNGSGSVSLSGGSYSQFVGPAKVTFINASGRLVNKVCNVLQDNGVAPAGQSGSFTLAVNGTSTALTGTEGAPATCTSGFQANIPIGATSLTAQDLAPFNMASGFPQVQATDANSDT